MHPCESEEVIQCQAHLDKIVDLVQVLKELDQHSEKKKRKKF